MDTSTRFLILSCLLVVATTACAVEEDGRDGLSVAADDRIVDGDEYYGDPGVGYLACAGGTAFCTGTLIGSQTVLTAGHCLGYEPWDWDAHDACGGKLAFYTQDGTGTHRHDVEVVVEHPQWDRNDRFDHDLAILQLAEPAFGTPTIALGATPTKDSRVDIVGYGRTSYDAHDTIGTKRIANVPITEVYDWRFRASRDDDGPTCPGDSGGPSLVESGAKRAVVGVHSTTDYCESYGVDVRVDAHHDWIAQVAGDDLGCGGVDYEGYCEAGAAVWCDGESLRYESCYAPGEVCGWAGAGIGYDCIAAGCGNGVVDAGEACDFGGGNDQRHRYRGGEGSSCGPDRQEVCDAGCGTLRTRENGLLSDCDAGDFCEWGIDCWMSGDNGGCTCG